MGRMRALAVVASLCLGACTLTATGNRPLQHRVMVDGKPYTITQLTASTWTAIAASPALDTPAAAPARAHRAALLRIIEQTSGCKVSDSDYSNQPAQLDAQVDCASRLQN